MQNAEWDLNLEQHIIQLLRWIARHGTSMHQIGYAAIKINWIQSRTELKIMLG